MKGPAGQVENAEVRSTETEVPATPYNGQLRGPNCTQVILNDPDLADTRRPFQQDCPPSLL